ncbi:hypothetical protein QE152_g8573 [Popillia japonica]|uniref:BHLH domain-containing protein n=1 Tax=Popillia japonica TaxID=7064 RepID=A0AAW1M2G9_POPJA
MTSGNEKGGSEHDIRKRKRIYNEEDAATILALDPVETNPKLSLRKRSTQLNHIFSNLQRMNGSWMTARYPDLSSSHFLIDDVQQHVYKLI